MDMPITASELNKLSKSLERQAPFGSEKWQEQICQQLGLESTMRQRGRPRLVTDL
ncbi:MAG: hypothetical protein L3J63_07195 [Geopsychrobacter sp.]|nr:hypothetical protein [Geopsychrobacter sp.]